MRRSMTGYSYRLKNYDNYDIQLELKSLNSKQLEARIKSNEFLGELEIEIYKKLESLLQRGKIELRIHITRKDESNYNVSLNLELAKEYKKQFDLLAENLKLENKFKFFDLIKQEGILTVEKTSLSEMLKQNLKTDLDELLKEILEMMEKEGDFTYKDIMNHLKVIEENVLDIEKYYPKSLLKYQNLLEEKLKRFIEETDDKTRIYMEMQLFAVKSAINEELERLKAHISQFKKFINDENTSSKKIDFLAQEMNREVNTIASKSQDIHITEKIVTLKSEIDKIREQLRNIL